MTARTNAPARAAPPLTLDVAEARADVCTVAEVARWLGVDKKTVYDAVHRRELPCARLGRRVLLSRAAITEWLAGRLR
ncbi:MAG: helix-turn-helix domain-containing protein [Kofleriaceae bacterium]|nr:helix-turn-helix domain-containing protein [Kofleriaceae bacterium]MCL4225574.1 helix-turn-helix domain-containing protein [Myxococcales bacterium]